VSGTDKALNTYRSGRARRLVIEPRGTPILLPSEPFALTPLTA
jgi:hypothetical protein